MRILPAVCHDAKSPFCSFDMHSHSKPQFLISNWRCERIKESYIKFMAEKGKYRFSLFIKPHVHDILLAIFCVCEFQLYIRSLLILENKTQ